MKPITIIMFVMLCIQITLFVFAVINLRKGKKLSALAQHHHEYVVERQRLLDEMQKFFDHDGSVDEARFNEIYKQIEELDERHEKIIGTQKTPTK